MDLREIGWDGVDSMDMAQDRDQWTRYWTFGFHKMLGSSWGAAQLAAPQEGLSSVSKYITNLLVSLSCGRCFHRIWKHSYILSKCGEGGLQLTVKPQNLEDSWDEWTDRWWRWRYRTPILWAGFQFTSRRSDAGSSVEEITLQNLVKFPLRLTN
jgi:hypothetical protein